MTYTINKSDGTKLVDILDGTIDTITDLNLIGKNSTTFGESLNENFVYLLENFSNTTPPNKPLVGQLWYDSSESRLKIYTGNINSWRAAGSPIVGQSLPLNLIKGDFWINDNDKQLYFYDGTTLTLAGPTWKKSQGVTGVVAKTIYDINENAKSVLQLCVKDTVLGLYSADAFTVSATQPVPGFTSVVRGYTSNSTFSTTFDINSVDAQKLNGLSGNSYLRSDNTADENGFLNERSIMSVPLSIENQDGLSIGISSNVNFYVSGQSGRTLHIENTVSDISLRTTTLGIDNLPVVKDNLYIRARDGFVGVLTQNPQRHFDVNGSARIRGNFEVDGKILTVPIELTLIDNDIIGYPNVNVTCTGDSGSNRLNMSSSSGIYQTMVVSGSEGLGNNPSVTVVNGPTEVTLSVVNDGPVSGSLTFIDPKIREKTKLILTDIAPPQYYMPNQLALVHYQHINLNNGAITISRYLKRYIVGSVTNFDGTTTDTWQYDSDLTSNFA